MLNLIRKVASVNHNLSQIFKIHHIWTHIDSLPFTLTDSILWLNAQANTLQQPNKHIKGKGNIHLLSKPSQLKTSAPISHMCLSNHICSISFSVWERISTLYGSLGCWKMWIKQLYNIWVTKNSWRLSWKKSQQERSTAQFWVLNLATGFQLGIL